MKRISKRGLDNLKKDEATYQEVFNNSKHICESCGAQLNTVFRDDNGKIINRWRYAHLCPKSIYPRLRHLPANIINLCLRCHQILDFGSNAHKEKMKNWPYIQQRIKDLKDGKY